MIRKHLYLDGVTNQLITGGGHHPVPPLWLSRTTGRSNTAISRTLDCHRSQKIKLVQTPDPGLGSAVRIDRIG